MAISRRRLLLASAGMLVSGCARGQGARWGDDLVPVYARPDRDEWPEVFRALPPETQAMYRYAVANREVLRYIPCFCGCVNGGHESNFDCYVRGEASDGRVRLDTMSFG